MMSFLLRICEERIETFLRDAEHRIGYAHRLLVSSPVLSGTQTRQRDFRPPVLLVRRTRATTSHSRERLLSRFPRFSQESFRDMRNLLSRSILRKTCKSKKPQLLVSSRASSVMNLRSCRTGSICQRSVSFQACTDRATSTETIRPLLSRNRLRHLPPRLTMDISL